MAGTVVETDLGATAPETAAPTGPEAAALAATAWTGPEAAAAEAAALTEREAAAAEPRYYPAFLDLRDRRCVVVGGGAMAAEKARELCAAGARVTVVAAQPGGAIEEMERGGRLRLRRRPYRAGDLAGAFLAIAAGDDPGEREAVWREASRRGLPLNSVDDLPRCSFIAGAVVRRGGLTVAVSTAGRAPALAVRLRQWLEGELGGEHARFLELAGGVRAALAERHPELARRRELWYRLVDSDVLELLRRGDEAAARRRFGEILGVTPADVGARGQGR
jgi:siroheme synthase-like protein